MNHRRAWVLGISLCLGCTRDKASHTTVPAQASMRTDAAVPPATTVSPNDTAAEIVVGSPRGLEAWRKDGSGKRLISATAARHPRFMNAGEVLVIHPNSRDSLEQGVRIERIALADGNRTTIATLPAFDCGEPPDGGEPNYFPGIDLQTRSDWVINTSGGHACLSLMDRNLNMAGILLRVRIDLRTGNVERRLLVGGEDGGCKPPADVELGEPNDPSWCDFGEPEPLAPGAATESFPYHFGQDDWVLKAGHGEPLKTLTLPEYTVEMTSPSGRWELRGGDLAEGDYIHRKLVLLDRRTGDIFPIKADGGAWPSALKPSGKKTSRRLRTPVKTLEVVGETDVRWLGATAHDELLIVDGLVIRPGLGGFVVDGEVAY